MFYFIQFRLHNLIALHQISAFVLFPQVPPKQFFESESKDRYLTRDSCQNQAEPLAKESLVEQAARGNIQAVQNGMRARQQAWARAGRRSQG